MFDQMTLPAAKVTATGEILQSNAVWASVFPPEARTVQALLQPIDAHHLLSLISLQKKPDAQEVLSSKPDTDGLRVNYRFLNDWHCAQITIISREDEGAWIVLAAEHQATNLGHAQDELLGNIVHSFNNHLSAMMGFTELALLDIAPEHPAHPQLQTVMTSGQTAVHFTRDLLACAGRSAFRSVQCSIDELFRPILHENRVLLSSVLPSDQVHLDVDFFKRALHDVIDFLKLQTGEVRGESAILQLENELGKIQPYFALLLSEQQYKMLPQHADYLFAPYYSTKQLSGRKGIGLAPAAGIIRQARGYIEAFSDPEHGCSILIVLPITGESSEHYVHDLPHCVPFICDCALLHRCAQSLLSSQGIFLAPVTTEQAKKIRWSVLQYPFILCSSLSMMDYLSAQKVLCWTPYVSQRSMSGVEHQVVQLNFQAEPLMQAIERLLTT